MSATKKSRAMEMLKHIDIEIDSVRLDKYYSVPSLYEQIREGKSLMSSQEKNATSRGSWKGKENKWKNL